jgi:hypothetical protein
MGYTPSGLTAPINRVEHVFQGRYKAILVEKGSYLLETARCAQSRAGGRGGRPWGMAVE